MIFTPFIENLCLKRNNSHRDSEIQEMVKEYDGVKRVYLTRTPENFETKGEK